MPFVVYGHSDDVIVVKGGDKSLELGCYNSFCTIELRGEGGGLHMRWLYGPNNTTVWVVEIRQISEEVLIPWDIRIEQGRFCGVFHTPRVIIECPPETELTWRKD